MYLSPYLLPEGIDGHQMVFDFQMPKSPTITGWGSLNPGTNLMNGAFVLVTDDGAIGPNLGGMSFARVDQD